MDMENEKVIIELDKLIAYCKKEFDENNELFEGINCPYDEGKYFGAKHAYADVAYKLMMMKKDLMEEKK
jgi:hypothetical protein